MGRSRPAMERRVVVLPQPLGPSRVNHLPVGTSKVTSRAALTVAPCAPGYSVQSAVTFSMFGPGDDHDRGDPMHDADLHLPADAAPPEHSPRQVFRGSCIAS